MVHLTSSSRTKHYDTACVFAEGEDESIRAGSCVVYRSARLVDAADVDQEVQRRRLKIRTISPKAFRRILDVFQRNAILYPHLIEAYEEAQRQGKAD